MQPAAPPRWDGLSVPRKRPAVATQRAQDRLVLLDLETGRYFTLEGAGDRMWELSDGRRSIEDIAAAVIAAFGADPAVVRDDAVELFTQLSREGLIDDAR
jgi:hypothetical protein